MHLIPDTGSCKRYAVSVSDFLIVAGSQLVRGSSNRHRLLYCLTVARASWNLTGRGKHRKAGVFVSESWEVRRKWMLGLGMGPDGPGL